MNQKMKIMGWVLVIGNIGAGLIPPIDVFSALCFAMAAGVAYILIREARI